ncbi:hypothetical protein CPB85DRAFT_1443778 [Mucidula mucida]|nr:hypothetical protein CPB85DRAFT_1443778 [Mucidula mucida]
MKAKHRHALQLNKALNEELRVAAKILEDMRRAKEKDIDRLIVGVFGKTGQDVLKPDKGTDVRVDWESAFEIYDSEGMSSERFGELEGG